MKDDPEFYLACDNCQYEGTETGMCDECARFYEDHYNDKTVKETMEIP